MFFSKLLVACKLFYDLIKLYTNVIYIYINFEEMSFSIHYYNNKKEIMKDNNHFQLIVIKI